MIPAPNPRQSAMSSTSSQPASVDRDAAVATLFDRLGAIVGAQQIRALYGESDPATVRAEWCAGLQAAGIHTAELEHGIAAVRMRKFAPNLGEFLQLCRPVLDPEVAWHHAAEGMSCFDRGEGFSWSHPAVYWAARGMRQALREGTFEANRRRWESAMLDQWSLGAWAVPPTPQRRLGPARPQAPLEGVPSMRAEIRDKLQRARLAAVERMAANALRMAIDAPVRVSTTEPDMTEAELAQRQDAAAMLVLDATIDRMRASGCGTTDEWRGSCMTTLRDVSKLPAERIRARLRATWPAFFGADA